MKIVINTCFGGFELSPDGLARYKELSGVLDVTGYSARNIRRDDKHLVQTVEELGGLASSWYSALHVVEIPDDINWKITEYDGAETVEECHRSWR